MSIYVTNYQNSILYNSLLFNIPKCPSGTKNTTVLPISPSYLVIIYIVYASFSTGSFRLLIKILNVKKHNEKMINKIISMFYHSFICETFSHFTHNFNLDK